MVAAKGDLHAKHAFLAGDFKDWLEKVPAREIVLVAGNQCRTDSDWPREDIALTASR